MCLSTCTENPRYLSLYKDKQTVSAEIALSYRKSNQRAWAERSLFGVLEDKKLSENLAFSDNLWWSIADSNR